MIVNIEAKGKRKVYITDAPEALAKKLKGKIVEVL